MKFLKDYPIKELKIIYNILYSQLPSYINLIDSELLYDLQHHLLLQAAREGIDVSQHAQWSDWLNQ